MYTHRLLPKICHCSYYYLFSAILAQGCSQMCVYIDWFTYLPIKWFMNTYKCTYKGYLPDHAIVSIVNWFPHANMTLTTAYMYINKYVSELM
jgi:hypothetical protein